MSIKSFFGNLFGFTQEEVDLKTQLTYATNLAKESLNQRDELQKKLNSLQVPSDPKETLFNSRNIIQEQYLGRTLPYSTKEIKLDPRILLPKYDNLIQSIVQDLIKQHGSNLTNDEKAIVALIWVMNNLKYSTNSEEYDPNNSFLEFWNMSCETLSNDIADCKCGATVIANILLQWNVPYWQIELVRGAVSYKDKLVGHVWCLYYSETLNQIFSLDWCFLPDATPIGSRREYKDLTYYSEVLFSFNQKYCFDSDMRTIDLTKTN